MGNRKFFGYIIILVVMVLGCNSTAKNVDKALSFSNILKKRGIIILSPTPAEIIKSSEVTLKIAISSDKLKGDRYYIHTYLDGEIVDHSKIKKELEELKITDLTSDVHKVEIIIADHADGHIETDYKDSVAFIAEVDTPPVISPKIPALLNPGLGFSLPEDAFYALLDVIVTRDLQNYKKILGRPYIKSSHKTMRKDSNSTPLVVTKISNVNIMDKGTETINGVKVDYITSKQTWTFSDDTVKEMELDLHFKNIDGKWIFFPIKGQGIPF